MKNTSICLLVLMLGIIVSCRNHKEVVKNSPAAVTQSASSASQPQKEDADSTKTDLYRFLVSFYSPGSGADIEYILKFEDSIGSFSEKTGKNINYEKSAWGREGETDFCLRLTEITPAQQTEFINSSRELLKNARWVHTYENQPCRHRRAH